MKKTLVCFLTLILLVTVVASSLGEKKRSPDDLYKEMVSLFGEAYQITRQGVVNEYGSFANDDGIIIILNGDEIGKKPGSSFVFLNRPNKPSDVWMFGNITDEADDYKKLLPLLRDYAKGYGVKDNCCWFMQKWTKQRVLFHTVDNPKSNSEYNDIDLFVKYIVDNYAPDLTNWYKNEYSTKN